MAVLVDISWLATLLSAFLSFALGALWYSGYLFGENWAAGVGIEFGPEVKQPIPALLLQLAGTFLLAVFIGVCWSADLIILGFLGGLTSSCLLMAGSLFGKNSWYATLAEGGFVVAMMLIMNTIQFFFA